MSDEEKSSTVLLDTSALIAWLSREPGGARVGDIFDAAAHGAPVLIAWPTLIELYYVAARLRGEGHARQQHASLQRLPVQFVMDVEEAVLLAAASIKSRYPLSFADSIIAAVAKERSATLVHKDPEYEPLAGEIDLEALPYKPQRNRR